ncbi:hypothetical protein [uncultured Robinsoniella sp.]|uniref:hypothetical protein n=1 Tax=uncultured Robinsoniella sp. TaxID=904190 RepID=UPI00374F0C7B
MTAIRSMLSFASEKSMDITPLYIACKTVKEMKTQETEMEYFETYQLAAILNAPKTDKSTEW